MIYDLWMPEHPHCRPQPPPPPPPQQGCQHKQAQWFTRYFDPNTRGSQSWYVGRRDVVEGNQWNNALQNKIASIQTVFELPWDNSLYATMMDRPDMYFAWHNPNSGAFYLSIGCANCSLRTERYYPQYQLHDRDQRNPEGLSGKALKDLECVKSSLRVFLATVLGEPILSIGAKCRHLHQDMPPLSLMDHSAATLQ